MASFTIGSFTISIDNNGTTCATLPQIACDPPRVALEHSDVFSSLELACAERRKLYEGGRIVKVRGTRAYTQLRATQRQAAIYAARQCAIEQETRFLKSWDGTTVVEHIATPVTSSKPTDSIHQAPLDIADKPSMASARKRQPLLVAKGNLDSILGALSKICKRQGTTIEIVGQQAVKAKYTRYEGRHYLKVRTKHEQGKRHKRDIVTNEWVRGILRRLILKTAGNKVIDVSIFKRGSSGLVLSSTRLRGRRSTSRGELFIIRGRYGGELYDSQSTVTTSVALSMHHYSFNEIFWNSFARTFKNHRREVDHKCNSNMDLAKCGELAAILAQALYPCRRVSCDECRNDFMSMSMSGFAEENVQRIQAAIHKIEEEGDDFAHIARLLKCYERFLLFRNPNADTFLENKKLIGTRNEVPFKNLNLLNELLMKGNMATAQELEAGSNLINELIRFQRNRTDNIEKGSLTHFRNKVSSKVHINLDLMCDNQLDGNGNFLWGKRAHHARRLLGNYFEIVDPDKGYADFVKRAHPNGIRKTAIGKLIISTNLDTFRQQMQGEPIPKMELSIACTSKLRGGYVYPCCCVTDENGAPVESEFKIPTKNHLVVGNTGDSKYVNMPKVVEDCMYIAKNGYCHVNIFLAMLINVSEDQAKDYTKMVRDLVMPKLGEWPTMLDVATSCYRLTVFFPDTQSAELPRILVDHNTKTMHVVDSFGSLSTGYHMLKANTVGQLIKFVNNDLESEMKHYRVGGIPVVHSRETSEEAAVLLLARGIYRPRELKTILERDPLLLLYGLLSPSVLMSMYTSKTLENIIEEWLHKDMSVVQICAALTYLAKRVSVSKVLVEQNQIIQSRAHSMFELVHKYKGHSPSQGFIKQILLRLIEDTEVNKSVWAAGFAPMHELGNDLREKKFKHDLHRSWQDLSWSEKLLAAKRSLQRYKDSTAGVAPREEDSRKTFVESATSYFGSAKSRCVSTVIAIKKRSKAKVHETIGKLACRTILASKLVCPDLVTMVSVLSAVHVVLQLTGAIRTHLKAYKELRMEQERAKDDKSFSQLVSLFDALDNKLGRYPTEQEFEDYLKIMNMDAYTYYTKHVSKSADVPEKVLEQGKGKGEIELERIVAFMALIMMMYDAERSDCVYKILNKIKGLMGSVSAEPVVFQSLDDVKSVLEEKKLTIDFELQTEDHNINHYEGATFNTWWQNQMESGRAIPHYRTEGQFKEFTRANAPLLAAEIAHSELKDFMVMGAVGSGKSTGLPYHLSRKGKVLILEPTKPLAENVHKQLSGKPFQVSATLKMRGHCVFGSAPITIMTSGFALHYYANNIARLAEYQFVIFDECHVHDASAMAMRCLLHEYEFQGKILKVSATPPGREPEYKTQFPVKPKIEDSLSFQQFVTAQGSGSNADVTQDGDSILIYVASYNEVDVLSKLLSEKGHKVTKVDGRTMKTGNVEIPTSGTALKKHFVVATNIIENGVTLDIDVVVDFGMKVTPELDMDCKLIRYNKVPISFGERIQRLGRVGRHKEGTFLRIGHTEIGLSAVPAVVSTEAAFYCFTYGLPVIAAGVVVSALSHCTVPQARTMMNFELPIFYTKSLVRFDGTMHPEVHKLLTKYKLRDSEIVLNKMAIPSQGVRLWKTAEEYTRLGARVAAPDGTRIPFHTKDVPDKLHEMMWEVINKHKTDASFGRVSSASACKIAYTLQTDVNSIQRTVCILDDIIAQELVKQEYFKNITSNSCSSSFSLVSITNAIRSHHMSDHTGENISVLQARKNQILEFKNLGIGNPEPALIRDYSALECVQFQSAEQMSKHLGLKGQWNKSILTKDLIVAGATLIGGIWMAVKHFKTEMQTPVVYQAKGKRSTQKLTFNNARLKKHAYEVRADESAEHYFGEAYSQKAPKKGKTRGLGTKSRRFYNMYGFDPTEYSFARYVDPLTGYTLDESTLTDIALVQDHFGKIRKDMLEDDKIESDALNHFQYLEAYFVKDLAKQIIKIDMTPHNPLIVCNKVETIAGFPERKGELRQTGKHEVLSPSALPKSNEFETVEFEGKAAFQGLRDYNPIATAICTLSNDSDGHTTEMHGIGYGSMIITNQHLFRRNNGSLTIQSHKGKYVVPNTTQLKMHPLGKRDMLIIQLPKDFPPFPQKLKFRSPKSGERVCMVGSNFQERYISSTVSETSVIAQKDDSHFYRHWISTKDGQCGLPLVSVKDGYLLGIHSMTSLADASSFFVSFPGDIVESVVGTPEAIEWKKQWKLNPDTACWGSLKVMNDKPDNLFKLSKDIYGLFDETVSYQGREEGWLYSKLHGNLKAVARTNNQLVTKHVVNGKCLLFATYLETHPSEKEYFTPLMGAYQKSKLNRDAYVADLFKYTSDITIGVLDPGKFEQAEGKVGALLKRIGFEQCDYVTDTESIFKALNMKAAVGALYHGKKKEYFEGYTLEDKQAILRASCERLYTGKMGVWNGSLKAELRAKEKVDLNKTRSFTAAPLDTLLGGKVCVDDFNNQFYSLNLVGPWSVGMTKFYGGWDKMLNALPDGWIYCDADGSQFDSSLTPYLINAVLSLRLEFMEEWDIGAQMLKNLYTEIVYTPIATPDGTIVKKFKGNNSGQPSTVVDNTLMVILSMYYASECYDAKEDLEEYCKYFVNGDDLVIAIRPDKEDFLDQLSELFLHVGLKYDFSSRHRKKENLWFMSHRGIQIDGQFIPKLEEERIVSILEWDRAQLPEHRLEAICASMIEAWGYKELLTEIRKFYYWVLSQAPYSTLSQEGKAPYISESALKALYTSIPADTHELKRYLDAIEFGSNEGDELVVYQADDQVNAGKNPGKVKEPINLEETSTQRKGKEQQNLTTAPDKDVNVGTIGTFSVPRIKALGSKLMLPKLKGRVVVNLDHLVLYEPDQQDLANTRATHAQFQTWFNKVMEAYGMDEAGMGIILNGLMVWCIENGTSPNVNGMWTMMDGEEQVEYPLKPIVENAQPTLRQVMAHFSDLAEAYIEKRNSTKPYMPRYGIQRNLRDMSLARYAFDFFEVTSKTPIRAREAHMQMKAAALRNAQSRLFGLDGNAGDKEEDTERHTANDVNRNMHSLMGVRMGN